MKRYVGNTEIESKTDGHAIFVDLLLMFLIVGIIGIVWLFW